MTENFKGAKSGGFIYTATLILFLIISLVGRAVLTAFHLSDTAYYAVSSLFSVSAFLCAACFYVRFNRDKRFFVKFKPLYVLPSLLLAAGMLLGLGFLNSLVAEGVKSVGGVVNDVQIPLDTPFQYVLFTVLLCVLPAIAEEIFFRGILTESLSGVKAAAGVFTVALCFALYHGSVAQLFYQFIYGVGLGFLTLKAKSVIPAVIAHFTNNFAVLSIEYFDVSLDLKNPLIIAIGAAFLAGFILFLIFYDSKPLPARTNTESIKDFYIPFGIIGVAVSVLLIVLSALPLAA
ncbi:MAG: CPBP family intramembrane metalloprotease [Clostridia bacterium]|nr:CPBP family intramembrane metalloprotease [Clostridia bacterium]